MKTLQINTTQNVKIAYKLADVGQRLLAFVLDNILKIGFTYFIVYSFIGDAGLNGWSRRAVFFLLMLPVTCYSLYSEILMNGQTLGKRVMGIRVVNINGFKPSIADYLMRWFMRMVDFNMSLLLFVYLFSSGFDRYAYLLVMVFFGGKLVGFISIIATKNNQRLGDITANTVVIALKDNTQFSQTILEDISDRYTPSYPSVIKLSDNDARIIKDMFTAAKKNRDHKTLVKLRAKIEEVTGVKSNETSASDFVQKILEDYNYYTQSM